MKECTHVLIAALLVSGAVAAQDKRDSAVFERIFGIPRVLPAELVEQTLALDAGEKLERDTDGDGIPDELWYLDTAKRHTVAPLLVRVVDEDGDLAETGRGDRDSDCYYWDHKADGFIDIVTDYVDDDGDGDVDQMGIFYDKNWRDGKDDFTVWWSVDIGDDNRLWYDVNGNYYQALCQWRTHFSGDELFYQFRLTEDDEQWVNVWEDPFAFYDRDDDLCSETVIRISAIGDDVKNLRYSIDADDDAYGRDTHNYDFSITALPAESGLSSADWSTDALTIRGIETLPLLPWDKTQAFSLQAPWDKAMFIWDELNSNTDPELENDPHERWEGLLNHASKFEDFPQVGGPACARLNKRVEVTGAPASPLRLYYDMSDRRLHLLGAEYGYLDVDFNLDGEPDAAYAWRDTDGDGVLDVRTGDVDAGGETDFDAQMRGNSREFAPEFAPLAGFYPKTVAKDLEDSQLFIDVAASALQPLPPSVREVIDFYAGSLRGYHRECEVGMRIQNTPAGARLYVGLVRDRLFVALREDYPQMAGAFLDGEYAAAAHQLAEAAGVAFPPGAEARPWVVNGRAFDKRIAVQVRVEDGELEAYPDSPVVLDVAALREQAPDFNPRHCVVVHGAYWLAWRPVPHQVDDFGFGAPEQLSFVADLPQDAAKTFYIFYSAEGEYAPSYPRRTQAVLDNPAYVAWESDAGAFRCYTGQFDFFGKQQARLLPPEDRLIYPLVEVPYHEEQDWGIDALHVGKTSGLGGLTLYLGDTAHRVQRPAGEGTVAFDYRVLGAGPVRAAVEIEARNVLPDRPDAPVLLRGFIYAGRMETEVQVRLPEGLDAPKLAPGLMKLQAGRFLAEPHRGMLSAWGRQGDDIGDIGLAVLFSPETAEKTLSLKEETRAVCAPRYPSAGADGAHFRYWIVGTWRRGMQYPVAPTADDWYREARERAAFLNAVRTVALGLDE